MSADLKMYQIFGCGVSKTWQHTHVTAGSLCGCVVVWERVTGHWGQMEC